MLVCVLVLYILDNVSMDGVDDWFISLSLLRMFVLYIATEWYNLLDISVLFSSDNRFIPTLPYPTYPCYAYRKERLKKKIYTVQSARINKVLYTECSSHLNAR